MPKEKEVSWIKPIKDYMASKKIKAYNMEYLIGKLNHVTHVIPTHRYFLKRILILLIRENKCVTQKLIYWNRKGI